LPNSFSAQVFGSTDIFLLKNSSCSRQPRSQASQKPAPSTNLAKNGQNSLKSPFEKGGGWSEAEDGGF